MKKFAFFLGVVCAASVSAQAPSGSDVTAWEKRAQGVTIVRDDWGIPHIHGKTDADVVFGADVRAGRRRLQSRRDELHQLHGPAGRGGGRERSLARPAHEAVHQSRHDEGEVRGESGVAEEADERLGRRAQLLPVQASRRHAAGHQAFRAVDGADVQRRQHRRRHREGESQRSSQAFYGSQRRGAGARPATRDDVRRAVRLERHRDRAVEHRPRTTRCC